MKSKCSRRSCRKVLWCFFASPWCRYVYSPVWRSTFSIISLTWMCQEVSLLWVCLLPSHGRYVASSGNFRPPQHEIKLSTADCEHAAALWQRRETVLTRCRTQVPSLSSSNTRLEASMLSHSHLAATRRSFIHVLIHHYLKNKEKKYLMLYLFHVLSIHMFWNRHMATQRDDNNWVI